MLSRKTKYGLKALTFLAKREYQDPIKISTIATSENISIKFLESILLTLRKGKILASKKGKGGGYYLLKNANEIKIDEVYRIFEGPIALVPCVSLNFYERCNDCPDEERVCAVHNLMLQVRDKTLAVFGKTTLEDLIKTT